MSYQLMTETTKRGSGTLVEEWRPAMPSSRMQVRTVPLLLSTELKRMKSLLSVKGEWSRGSYLIGGQQQLMALVEKIVGGDGFFLLLPQL